MSKKKIDNQNTLDFGNTVLELFIIEFPLYLKNVRKDGKSNLFWRYHEDGRYEVITFGKENNSFVYGRNEYWKGKDHLFDKTFMTVQVRNNLPSSEDEFIEKYEEMMSLHNSFLGNTKQKDPETSSGQSNGKENKGSDKKVSNKDSNKSDGRNFGGIIVKDEGEEDPF